MNIHGVPTRTIRLLPGHQNAVEIIDQRFLPHALVFETLHSTRDVAAAIREMHVRGAGLIGVTAAFGMALAAQEAARTGEDASTALRRARDLLVETRPTAVNLAWAANRVMETALREPVRASEIAFAEAGAIAEEDVAMCRAIGEHGFPLLEAIAAKKNGDPVNILTHCNAGWLAFVDIGSATAPIYHAHNAGIPVHVWVDETRPRNQGAKLTAWELGMHGVPHTLIADNTGGHLMQHGMVDIVIVGTDRTTRTGDVANKIGTYLKALAATDNGIPFYVALPSSSFDWTLRDGIREIPIERRGDEEVQHMDGLLDGGRGRHAEVLLCPPTTPAANFGFDVTPARLVTGLITERGICPASEEGISGLFPDLMDGR